MISHIKDKFMEEIRFMRSRLLDRESIGGRHGGNGEKAEFICLLEYDP